MSNDTQPEIRFPGFTEAWEQRKLGEVVESVGTGRSTFTNGIVQTSETPYAVLGSTSVISYDSMFDHSGDFILTARVGANAGNLYKYFGEVKISDNTVYIQANNLDFIYYLLTKYDLKRLSFGTGQPLVKASEVKNLKLNFPQKNEEQQKIGSFFKQLDDTIALHQRKLDLLKETKKGFLQKMFPKNGAKVPEIRFPGFTGDWEEKKFKEVINSGIKGKAKAEMSGTKSLYLDTNYLNGGVVTYVDSPRDVENDDVLILWDGSQAGTVYYGFSGALGSTLKAYRAKESGAFLYQQLKRNQQIIYDRYRTPNIPHVVKTFTDEFMVSMPSSEEQQKIGAFFKQLDDTIALHQRKLDLLKETKKGFLQKMFV
ncbi:restriction endonuclease subunit S [Enterococcus faecium]|uniref:restriction endonuclease subunit S n=1 Tax=Enterococcus faecium TaxID=1352 RepID=UPI00338E5B91